MKKFVLNYDEKNNDMAVRIAEKIVDCLNNGEYDDLDIAIWDEVAILDDKYHWEILKTYQRPRTASYNRAFEMLIKEIHSVIEETENEND